MSIDKVLLDSFKQVETILIHHGPKEVFTK